MFPVFTSIGPDEDFILHHLFSQLLLKRRAYVMKVVAMWIFFAAVMAPAFTPIESKV